MANKNNNTIPWFYIIATTAVTATVTYFVTSYLREREGQKRQLLALEMARSKE